MAQAAWPAAHNVALRSSAGPFLMADALRGACFCPRLAPSGRHAKAYQLNIKDAESRGLSTLHFYLISTTSHLLSWVEGGRGGGDGEFEWQRKGGGRKRGEVEEEEVGEASKAAYQQVAAAERLSGPTPPASGPWTSPDALGQMEMGGGQAQRHRPTEDCGT
ncbi:unnamed protein product [Pleuronectes platessa]|uniref:Uncharacterized protein n=1 Tax=Pleuronectes platessa TaxID=8262 RepID=A0A9N7TUY9_PLEPL|nr:unnamed protein product [Pleuronectes platessa]